MTDTEQQPKIKFKKRNINKKKHLRKVAAAQTTNTHNDTAAADSAQQKSNDIPAENIEEEEEEGALSTILAVDRRRKLLNNRNRGVDSTHLLKPIKSLITTATNTTDDDTTTNHADMNKNKDLEERLKGTFSEGKLAGSNDMGGDDEGGILAKKHKKAMEEYIQQNLQSAGVTDAATKTAPADGGGVDTGPNEDDKELFAELLQSDNGNATNNAAISGDVGAGGAMMMGSGIAEVALPSSEQLRTLKETERAAMEHEKAHSRQGRPQHDVGNGMIAEGTANDDVHSLVPMNFASGPGKRKRQGADMLPLTSSTTASPKKVAQENNEQSTTTITSSSAAYSASSAGGSVQRSDVSTLGQSYSHNFQLHQQDWIAQRRDERQVEIDTIKTQQKQTEEANNVSAERMGFEMARRVAKGESVRSAPARGPNGESLKNEWDRTKKGAYQRSSDDRVWKQFMKNTKR